MASSEVITLLLPRANSAYTISCLLCLERRWVPDQCEVVIVDSFGRAYPAQIWLKSQMSGNQWGQVCSSSLSTQFGEYFTSHIKWILNLKTQDGPELYVMAVESHGFWFQGDYARKLALSWLAQGILYLEFSMCLGSSFRGENCCLGHRITFSFLQDVIIDF